MSERLAERIEKMKHIKVYQTLRGTTSVVINLRRHGNVTPSSLERLGNIVLTQQMLNNCEVTPLTNTVGWIANIYKPL
jgi:hypothetical protein